MMTTVIHDQAVKLRQMRDQRPRGASPVFARENSTGNGASDRCCSVTITSGKGGVGKSHLALNVALALAEKGNAVCLIDGNRGLGNLDLLCGLNGYWNLSHVVSGSKSLDDVLLNGPLGIQILTGGSELAQVNQSPRNLSHELLRQFRQLESRFDYLIVDPGCGSHRLMRQFALAANFTWVVSTLEAAALAEAYTTLKALSSTLEWPELTSEPREEPRFRVVLNQVESREQAEPAIERLRRTTQLFLKMPLGMVGVVPRDPSVAMSANSRVPFLLSDPHGPAAIAARDLAIHLQNEQSHCGRKCVFFERLWNSMERCQFSREA